jgi:ribosomal protein L37AE/L43A
MPRVCKTCGRKVAEAAYCPFCSEPTIEYVPVPVHRSEGSEVRTLLTEFQRRNNRRMEFVTSIIVPLTLVGLALKDFVPIVSLAFFVLVGAVYSLTLFYGLLSACPCPRCEKNLAHLRGQNIRYCPYCGVDLAVEIYPKSQEVTEVLKKVSGQPGSEIKNTNIQLSPEQQRASTDIQLLPGKAEKGAPK